MRRSREFEIFELRTTNPVLFMNSNVQYDPKSNTSITPNTLAGNSSQLELIPGGPEWKPVMTPNQYHEFREWWHETVLPDLLAIGRLIVRP